MKTILILKHPINNTAEVYLIESGGTTKLSSSLDEALQAWSGGNTIESYQMTIANESDGEHPKLFMYHTYLLTPNS